MTSRVFTIAQASWQPVFTSTSAANAVAVATEVARRLNDPARLAAAVDAVSRQSSFASARTWHAAGIAQGYAGLALMCGYADACLHDGSDVVAHRHLAAAAAAARHSSRGDGLFSGLGGLVFATSELARGGTRYRAFLTSLKNLVLPRIVAFGERLAGRSGMRAAEFDVISGAAGMVAFLLPLRDDPDAAHALRVLLSGLTALLDETPDGLPRWFTPASMLGDPSTIAHYPHGNLNCGLAHGVPGPLAALALAHHDGVRVAGMGDAIRRTADWLVQERITDAWGVTWPYAVPLIASEGTPLRPAPASARSSAASRSAWCYGGAGVARALWLAGEALDDDALRDVAIDAVETVLRRPASERGVSAPTLCHGVGGLLAVVLRFASDTRRPALIEGARALCGELLDAYEPETLLGFRDIELGGVRVDRPGVLDGAAGVALVLLAAATKTEPTWDRLFLLS